MNNNNSSDDEETNQFSPSKRRRSNEDNENADSRSPQETLSDNDNDDDTKSNNSDNEGEKRAKRRRLRLLKEVRELQQSSSATIFPGDDGYNEITDNFTSTNNDANTNDYVDHDDDDDDDGDYVDQNSINNINADEDGMRYLDDANNNIDEEEEGEGEDLLENAFQDYQKIDALDNYGREGIDDRQYQNMDYDERMAAEGEIALREEERRRLVGKGRGGVGRSGRFYEGLMDGLQEDEDARRVRRARMGKRGIEGLDHIDNEVEDDEDLDSDGEDEMDEAEREEELFETEEELNLEAFDVPLREWIAQDRTRREVIRKFRRFLQSDIDDPENLHSPIQNNLQGSRRKQKKTRPMYEDRIRNMCSSNQCTLEISYMHLVQVS